MFETLYRRRLCAVLCAASLAIAGCKNRNRPPILNGTWKLDVSNSRVQSYFAIAIASDGLITVTNEAYSYSFRCDNEVFRNAAGNNIVCDPLTDRQWRFTSAHDAHTVTWYTTSDGSKLIIRTTETRADKPEKVTEKIYTRHSGAKGFDGEWQDTTPFISSPQLMVLSLDGQHLYLAYPEIDQYSVAPIDGSAVPIHGPHVRPGSTISVTLAGPHEFRTKLMFLGRLIREGTLDISEDGGILIQQSWASQNPNDKDKLVYKKQSGSTEMRH